MPVRHLAMIAAGGLLLAAAPLSSAHAQAKPSTKATTTTATAGKDSIQTDARFVREAVEDNLLEVRLGDSRLSLRRNEAARVEVQLLP